MAHELLRIKSKLNNTPLLMEPSSFDVVYKYLEERSAGGFSKQAEDGGNQQSPSYGFIREMGVGIINIEGPLTYKPITVMGFDCGGANYQTIKENFDTLLAMKCKTIVLSISSGGGEAYQMFDTGRYLREQADANNVHLISYVDGLAASAAYGLAVAGHEIISTSDSEVGSVGVLVRLINDSKALEQEGYERTFVSAGDSKIPFAADGSWREDFIQDLQEKVNATYKEFVSYVAGYRELSVQSVIDTQAKTFMTDKAMSLGLIDRVMNHEQFKDYLISLNKEDGSSPVFDKLFAKNSNSDKEDDNTDDKEMKDMELQEQLSKLSTEMEGLQEQLKALQSDKESLQAALEAARKEAEDAVSAKEEMKHSARKEKLSAVLPSDQVESIQESLKTLDDGAFEAVLAGFSAKQEARKDQDEFKELGHTKEGQQKAPEKIVTRTEEIIRQRYKK